MNNSSFGGLWGVISTLQKPLGPCPQLNMQSSSQVLAAIYIVMSKWAKDGNFPY